MRSRLSSRMVRFALLRPCQKSVCTLLARAGSIKTRQRFPLRRVEGTTAMPDPMDSLILADLCRSGDPEAARQLFEQYVDRLVALARRRLSRNLAGRVDPEDIVQSVFRTF